VGAAQVHQRGHHVRRTGLGATAGGGTAGLRRRCKRGEHEGATEEARGKVSGRGSHQSDGSSMGGRRRPSAVMFQVGGGEQWPVVTRGRSCDSVKARRW
jgi:hypothetical protein